jgi:hypothetical protein
MKGDADPRWPRFTLVKYSHPTGIPSGWDEELLEKGAPDGINVGALKELMLLEDPASEPLVSFGTGGLYDRVCLDPRTNCVVLIGYGALRVEETHPVVFGTAHFINSSLDQFIESVRVVTERFPYDTVSLKVPEHLDPYEWNLSDEDWDKLSAEHDQAANDLIEALRRIESAAVTEQGFWTGFVDDVQMGNYATRYWRNPSRH